MFKHTDKVVLGVDIGGSHISSALVNSVGQTVETVFTTKVDTKGNSCKPVIDQWIITMQKSIANLNGSELKAVGVAMPGPFDYERGIGLFSGVDKYESLYGVNIKALMESQLNISSSVPIVFENDAACFGLGEAISGEGSSFSNIIAVTLGTGFGTAFIQQKKIVKSGAGVPQHGYLYNIPYKDGIAEDYISSRWLLKKYYEVSGKRLSSVKKIAESAQADNDPVCIEIFKTYGNNLSACLAHWIRSFKADCLVIGGSISYAAELFLPELIKALKHNEGINIPIKISKMMEKSAIAGAADLAMNEGGTRKTKTRSKWRKSSQQLMPQHTNGISAEAGAYNIYPFHSLGHKKIFAGYSSLADWIISQKLVAIDGYGGNDWAAIRERLTICFREKGISVVWYETSAFEKPESEIAQMVTPYLGDPESVWGKKAGLVLEDFYHVEKLRKLQPDESYDVAIVLGVGAAMCGADMPIVYVDLPKNEIQYRMRAGSVYNLGTSKTMAPSAMYKRFYFVDWVVLNGYRQKIRNRISVVADGQWRDNISWALSSTISSALEEVSKDTIRVRPWFEAGAWGGQWMKEHIPSLNKNEINYAWSFELIVPENGLVFESDNTLLEISFDWLMESCSKNVLGKDVARFGTNFPIRFDFLDTFDGGNLSIQCHPSLQYIRENFGESITQDETYYILDCKKDAGVYLGFQENIDAAEFRETLEKSEETDTPVEIKDYVQWLPAHKHDLFLIPNGTIHSSGANNLVLEISATPYIFTFKMYDWLRLDLEGNPRPINIAHAFHNLNFERKGEKVQQELISHPRIHEKNQQCTVIHLPTHEEHFYDVHRIEFVNEAEISTDNKCHVLMLVEGTSVMVKTKNGTARRFNYAETFIIPAGAESYQLKNEGIEMARVIKAFIK